MSLYDIIDEIAEKQTTKSDTGDPRVYGAMIGLVTQNYNKDMPGRVCVSIPTRDNEANELQWVRVAHTSGGSKWGHYFLPEVGDQVLLVFEGGNIEKPYVVGCIPKDGDRFLTGSVDAKNKTKRIVTKNGSELRFEDGEDAKGDRDKITLTTAGGTHRMRLDNSEGVMEIADKKNENTVKLRTKDGAVEIKAKSRLTITVGENIKLTLNGDSGGLRVECDSLTVSASKKLSVTTDGMMKVQAAQVSEKASSMYKLESSGIVKIAGSPIKIG
ncbi:MAG: phage baseplate assembly protein V [Clostridiales Family XIII bacterium]|jgi:uncharacterized protein involved in type VI secretion and phage assembly|nr:phage baseplate assembly protein V [Clostridiales Family XIII bacterium]